LAPAASVADGFTAAAIFEIAIMVRLTVKKYGSKPQDDCTSRPTILQASGSVSDRSEAPRADRTTHPRIRKTSPSLHSGRSRSRLALLTIDTSAALHIHVAQHFGGGGVEELTAADFLEAVQQILGPQAALFGAAEIVNDPPAVHHDEAIAKGCRL